jgi:tetratricopeptide (TPR) repeat protein
LVFIPSALLHAAEALHQKTAEELVGEGNRLVQEGLYRESARFYKKAYDDYQNTDAVFNLALVYDRYLNLDRKAVIYYRKFLELVPEDPDKERILEWIASAEQDQSNPSPKRTKIQLCNQSI